MNCAKQFNAFAVRHCRSMIEYDSMFVWCLCILNGIETNTEKKTLESIFFFWFFKKPFKCRTIQWGTLSGLYNMVYIYPYQPCPTKGRRIICVLFGICSLWKKHWVLAHSSNKELTSSRKRIASDSLYPNIGTITQYIIRTTMKTAMASVEVWVKSVYLLVLCVFNIGIELR